MLTTYARILGNARAAAAPDPKRFRVNLVCGCRNDLAYGYGATAEEARTVAQGFFRKHHGRRARPAEGTRIRCAHDLHDRARRAHSTEAHAR